MARIVAFGVCSGLMWSLAPGILAGLFANGPLPSFLSACAITGVLVSSLLALPLRRAKRWVALLLGVPALLAGSFCFGLTWGLFSHDSPIETALLFAATSTLSPFAIALVPCAVLTAVLLWKCLLRPNDCV